MGRRALKFLTLRETKSLMKQIKNARDKAIFLIAYRHGLRASEIGKLRMGDVNLQDRTIYLTRLKGSVSGYQKIDNLEVAVLLPIITKSSTTKTLFTSQKGNPISRQQLDKLMKKYSTKARLPKSKRHFHILKHSIAVHLLQAGAEIILVKELLGHKSIQNTLVYAQVVSKYRDERQVELFESKEVF